MKILKCLLILIVGYISVSVIYSQFITPRIKIINNSGYNLKLYKSESRANSIEPTLEEVEKMLRSTVVIEPNNSYSFGINRKYIISNEENKLNTSLKSNSKTIISNEFLIQKKGFCSYNIDVYDAYTAVSTNGLNFCYKKLFMVKEIS